MIAAIAVTARRRVLVQLEAGDRSGHADARPPAFGCSWRSHGKGKGDGKHGQHARGEKRAKHHVGVDPFTRPVPTSGSRCSITRPVSLSGVGTERSHSPTTP